MIGKPKRNGRPAYRRQAIDVAAPPEKELFVERVIAEYVERRTVGLASHSDAVRGTVAEAMRWPVLVIGLAPDGS